MFQTIYDLDTLGEELSQLPPFHRIAFAASCCERLLPNYYIFSREESKSNPSYLQEALDEVWLILGGKQMDRVRILELKENCMSALVSDEEVFHSRYNYEAQLASIAISDTLEALLNLENIESIISVLNSVGDTIYEFLRIEKEISDRSWLALSYEEQDREIGSHPFTLREIAKQNQDIQRLKEVKTLDREFLEWLRTSSYNNGKSLIDLS